MFIAHPLSASRAGSPRLTRSFVAPDMYIFRREYPHHFGEHILQESERFFITHTEIGKWFAGTRERGISVIGFIAMTRHFDFGNDSDASLCSITHNFAELFLCIKSAIGTRISFMTIATVILIPPFLPVTLRAISTLGYQLRIFLNLHSPTAGIGQVQVQPIQFKVSQRIDLL